MPSCNAQYVGKSRNGSPRYWCTTHHAPISDGKGNILDHCLSVHSRIPECEDNSLTISPSDYPGGIALWGAALAVYETTPFNLDLGIHVHARKEVGGVKQIDKTFRYVHIKHNDAVVSFDYLASISYLSSNMLGRDMEYLVCPKCGSAHLDKDWFAANPHKRHLCTACGRNFNQKIPNIGNPMIKAKEFFGDTQIHRAIVNSNRSLEIRQKDFPFGISVWGSNAALLWTSPKPEEYGIHIHAHAENSIHPTIDETYNKVVIDGIPLDVEMVRLYMVQMTLPYLKGRVKVLKCPQCNQYHFDTGEHSYTPHSAHHCQHCGQEFKTRIKSIGNPMEDIIRELSNFTSLPLKNNVITEFYPGLEGW